MKIPTVSKCCCCLELRTGGMVLSILAILSIIPEFFDADVWSQYVFYGELKIISVEFTLISVKINGKRNHLAFVPKYNRNR